MKKNRIKTLLALLPLLFFGSLQAQTTLPPSYVREASTLLSSESIIRSIFIGGNIYDILYSFHSSSEGAFILSETEDNLRQVPLPNKVQVSDMKVIDKFVYWCGSNTSTGKGVAGYFDASQLLNNNHVNYHMTEIPIVSTNCTTYNASRLEVLSTTGAFPHLALMCDITDGTDTTTGLGELWIDTSTNNLMFSTIFIINDMEIFYDMTLTNNYLLTTSLKDANNNRFPYMIRYFSRDSIPFLPSVASTPLTIPHLYTQSTTVSPHGGFSVIEALTGNDFVVAYHSRNDSTHTSSKIYLDIYTNVTFGGNLTTTYSAMLSDSHFQLTRNKMFDLAYDMPHNTIWLLHEVDSSHMQNIVKINNTLTSATVYSYSGTCLQSIDYNNALGMGTTSGYNTENNKLVEIGEQAGSPNTCMTTRTSRMISEQPKTIHETAANYYPAPGTAQATINSRPVSIVRYKYRCKLN